MPPCRNNNNNDDNQGNNNNDAMQQLITAQAQFMQFMTQFMIVADLHLKWQDPYV